jgi:hypothetical protein
MTAEEQIIKMTTAIKQAIKVMGDPIWFDGNGCGQGCGSAEGVDPC